MSRCTLVAVLVVAAAGWAVAQEAPSPKDYVAIADDLARSLVRVEYTLQYDKGDPPGYRCPSCGQYHAESGEVYVRDERPLEAAGFLLAPTKVVTPDLVLHPRFVKSVAVRFGSERVNATPSSYAKHQNARFLELERPLAEARPLPFDAGAKPPYLTLTYAHDKGSWNTSVSPWPQKVCTTDTGRQFLPVTAPCLILDKGGRAVGMWMEEELPVDDSWKGSPEGWETLSVAEMTRMLEELDRAAAQCFLRVELGFRSPKKVEMRSYQSWDDREEEGATARNVTGIVIGEKTILVLASLQPKTTARLERIVIHPEAGPAAPAKFTCSLSDYGAFLAEPEQPLPGAVALSSASLQGMKGEFLASIEVTVQGEKRTVHLGHTRIASFETGWRQKVYPLAAVGVGNRFLFAPEGALLALPVSQRKKVTVQERHDREEPTMTPAVYLKEVLDDLAKQSDLNNVPLREEEESRLAWLGAELQPLNRELARANNVSDLTHDGESGALVAYVYPDSPASQAGIEPGTILLRLYVEGQPKPLEVKLDSDRGFPGSFPWDRLDEVPEQFYERLPRPWPQAENEFTRSLTDLGFGKAYTAEFFQNGKVLTKEFQIVESPPHYDTAPRYESKGLGLTVRNLTYEVRRYLQRSAADPGVIVSKVEPGSKASVSGIKPYEIITQVNDVPIQSVKDFEILIQGKEELRLSVLRMTLERQVRVRMEAAEAREEPGQAKQ